MKRIYIYGLKHNECIANFITHLRQPKWGSLVSLQQPKYWTQSWSNFVNPRVSEDFRGRTISFEESRTWNCVAQESLECNECFIYSKSIWQVNLSFLLSLVDKTTTRRTFERRMFNIKFYGHLILRKAQSREMKSFRCRWWRILMRWKSECNVA